MELRQDGMRAQTTLFRASVCLASSSACVKVVLNCCSSPSKAEGTDTPFRDPVRSFQDKKEIVCKGIQHDSLQAGWEDIMLGLR